MLRHAPPGWGVRWWGPGREFCGCLTVRLDGRTAAARCCGTHPLGGGFGGGVVEGWAVAACGRSRPCPGHDPAAAVEYASRLAARAEELAGRLFVVMRVYFEKPRSTVGWKGLINDPRLDGSYKVNEGLRRARQLLLDILALGLPVGCE